MENFYILKGSDKTLLEEKRKEIIEKIEIENPDENVIFFDFAETEFSEILQELTTYSFFTEKKCIIVHHFNDKKISEQILENFYTYLKNPILEHFLIFEIEEEIINNDFLSQIKRFGKMIIINSLSKDEVEVYAKNRLKKENISIDTIALIELLNRCEYKYELVRKEIEKIILYCLNEQEGKIIRLSDIKDLVPRNLEENIYVLTNYILEKNKSKALETYYDLILNGDDSIRILNIITKKMKELLYTKTLLDQNATKEEIAIYFGVTSGRAFYMIKDSGKFSKSMLENYYNKLLDLDYKIKSGQNDKSLGLELFILNL